MSVRLRLSGGRVFPDPSDPREVQWRLRYGEPTRDDLMEAAAFMAAYQALCYQPLTASREVLREIRGQLNRNGDGRAVQ